MKYKLSLLLNVVLIVLLGVGAYKVVVVGSIMENEDGRTSILVEAGEREFLLAEMRVFLETIQEITAAIAVEDMESVSEIAASLGMEEVGGAPAALIAKLPISFKTRGMDIHKLFDGIALAAQETGDPLVVTGLLGELMLGCTSCHQNFRFDLADDT